MTEAMREQFEAGVRQWPNYSERTLARDGRYPDYYGNPVVQGAWEGFKLALRSPAVAGLVEACKGFPENPNPYTYRMAHAKLRAALAQYATLAGEKA